MNITAVVNLDDVIGFEGDSVATIIAQEMRDEIKKQVRKELRDDPSVNALVKQLKNAAIEKMMADFSNNP